MSRAPSYANGVSATPLDGATLGAAFDAVAAHVPDNDCVVSVHQGQRLTYAQMRTETDRLAAALAAIGVGHGERVGIWSTNNLEWVVTQFATPKIGAILVNINPAFRVSELDYVLRQSGVSVLITQDRYKTSDYLAMVRELRAGLTDLRAVIVIGTDVALEGDERSWETLLAQADTYPADALLERGARAQCDDPINIQYTSGTTGHPKGATLSHHNVLNNGFFIGEGCRYTAADRVCIPVPFYHCFGMVLGNLACITHGATIVIPAPTFAPGPTLAAVAAERCTALYGVPTMFIAELAEPDFRRCDLSTLRTGIMAGSPCPVEVMKRVQTEMHMPEVTICYGMTETSPVSTQTGVADPLEKRTGTVGRVHPHLEVMLGYWNDPAQTAEVIDPARYMHTGDIAIMDDEGYVNISGRIKDMVIRGGENIYPREVEEFLYTHPAIKDVAVIGVPDERYGEALCAWIIPHAGSAADPAEIAAFCSGRIAHYKIPPHILFVQEFPMTVTGKVQKYKMRERSIELLGLGDAAKIVTA
jgi:fatty-acyl-CoA synthase